MELTSTQWISLLFITVHGSSITKSYPFYFLNNWQIHSLLISCQSHWKSLRTRLPPIILRPSDHSQSDPATPLLKNSSVAYFALRITSYFLHIVSRALHHLTSIFSPCSTSGPLCAQLSCSSSSLNAPHSFLTQGLCKSVFYLSRGLFPPSYFHLGIF